MRRLIVGLGVTGAAVARFLNERNAAFDTFDDRKQDSEIADLPRSAQSLHMRSPAAVDLNRYGEVVVSPGVDARHPIIVAAIRDGLSVVSEVALAHRYARGRIVAVTGTNGKSTTVSLIHHILCHGGFEAALCGNIGTPFIASVGDPKTDLFVLEVSSFQMEFPGEFRPQIGVLLNLSPDHMDRHGSMEAYERAKFNLFYRQEPGDLALVHPDYSTRVPGRGEKHAVPGPGYEDDGSSLCFDTGFRVPLEGFALLGRHNRVNALFAAAVARHLGLPAKTLAEALTTFRGLEHRMEPAGELEGRLWINDSKATNVHAAQAVIGAMDRDYVLIMGGCDKRERFGGMQFGQRPPRAIVAYGETASIIREDLADYRPEIVPAFEDACRRAHQLAQPGQIVLLAPACASYDQFNSYSERGRAFKALCHALGGSP